MILIGTNNKNNNTMPTPFPNDKSNNSRMMHKIKNSSSFPQSFDNIEYLKQQQNLAKRPPIERRNHKNQQFDQPFGQNASNFNASSSSVVPLIVGHSTTTLNTRRSPQQQPRTNAYNQSNNNHYQQHHYRSPNVSGTIEQMKKYQQQQQPQTGSNILFLNFIDSRVDNFRKVCILYFRKFVFIKLCFLIFPNALLNILVICRRSTSLPRRIISAAQSSPPTKQLPQHSSEHQQRNDLYQKPPLMGTNYANKHF